MLRVSFSSNNLVYVNVNVIVIVYLKTRYSVTRRKIILNVENSVDNCYIMWYYKNKRIIGYGY